MNDTYWAYGITAEDVAAGTAPADDTTWIVIQVWNLDDESDYGEKHYTYTGEEWFVDTKPLADDQDFRDALEAAGWRVITLSHEGGQTTAELAVA